MDSLRNKIERWLTHETYSFKEVSNKDNIFHFLIKHAGESGTPVDIFEPSSQPGILVIGCKTNMKNSQIVRYLNLSDTEKKKFEDKMGEFCKSIGAVFFFQAEDGIRKIGVYVVLDNKDSIDSTNVISAINKAAEMHDKTSKYLLKTF